MKTSSTFIVADSDKAASVEYFTLVSIDDINKLVREKVELEDIVFEGNTIDDFISSLFSDLSVTVCYIHDYKFMSRYILDWLLRKQCPLTTDFGWKSESKIGYNVFGDSSGEIYLIKLYYRNDNEKKTCEIRSSLNKTRSKLIDLYYSFEIDKEIEIESKDINCIYDTTIQTKCLNDDEKYSCMLSSLVLADVMYKLTKSNMNKLTIGSDANKEWKKLDGDKSDLMPEIIEAIDESLRNAYRGGFTWCKPEYVNKEIGEGIVLDVNSLYPYVMRNYNMPYGKPLYYDKISDVPDGYYYIAHVILSAKVKKDAIPCIMAPVQDNVVNNDCVTEFVFDNVWLTNFDIEMLKINYDVSVFDDIEVYAFKTIGGIFDNFIDKHYEIKRTSKGAKRQISKLMLDSLYGRFGLKLNKKKTKIVIDENSNTISYKTGDKFDNKLVHYLPIAIFITSIARYLIVDNALGVYDRLIYIDTDSLHLVGREIPDICDISDKLGDYKIESVFARAKYLGIKTYIHDEYVFVEMITDDNNNFIKYKIPEFPHVKGEIPYNIKTVIKMCGATEKVKENINWDNFKYGQKVPGHTILKILPGGCVRQETEYTITQTI